jgi:outer membrane protein assembly factor BamB
MPSRRQLLAAASAGAAGLAGCTALADRPEPEPLADASPGSDDWPFLRYDSHNTGWNGGADPPAEPTVRWSTDVGWGFTPLVRGTRVVLNSYEGVMGLRATDGEVVWTAGEGGGYRQPGLGARRAFFPDSRCVRGFDLESGEETWRQRACDGANTAAPTVARGRLYMEASYVVAFDAAGRATWAAYGDAMAAPTVAGDTAFADVAGELVALDLTVEPDRPAPWAEPPERPVVDRERVRRWGRPYRRGRIRHSPTVHDGLVVVGQEDIGQAALFAHDPEDGDRKWRFRADTGENGGLFTAPVSDGERVYVGSDDGNLYAVTDGEAVWTRSLDGLPNRVAGAGDTLLVGTYTGDEAPSSLYALAPATGESRWRVDYDDELRGLSAAGGSVYATVVTGRQDDGDIVSTTLYAYG